MPTVAAAIAKLHTTLLQHHDHQPDDQRVSLPDAPERFDVAVDGARAPTTGEATDALDNLVNSALDGLTLADRRAVADFFDSWGDDDATRRAYGVDKRALVAALDVSAASLPSAGASSVLGYLAAHDFIDAQVRGAPVPEPSPAIDPASARRRQAENALKVLSELRDQVSPLDVHLVRQVPAPHRMNDDDASYVVQHLLDQVSLSQAARGEWSLEARVSDSDVSNDQVRRALALVVGPYDLDVTVVRSQGSADLARAASSRRAARGPKGENVVPPF